MGCLSNRAILLGCTVMKKKIARLWLINNEESLETTQAFTTSNSTV